MHSIRGVSAIYQYLLSSIDAEYETVKTIKNSERGCVSLLQNKQNGTRFIFRHYQGSGEVYRKLLSVSCRNLPKIMEAAEQGGMVAVQIVVYQTTHGKKQLFRTAPLHRWMELRGSSAVQIFYTFCVLALLGAALALQWAKIS